MQANAQRIFRFRHIDFRFLKIDSRIIAVFRISTEETERHYMGINYQIKLNT